MLTIFWQIEKQETQKIKVASLQANREGYVLLSGFMLVILLIMYVWWPLVVDYFSYFNPNYPVWRQLDRLLIGIFLFMCTPASVA